MNDLSIRLAEPKDIPEIGKMVARFWIEEDFRKSGLGLDTISIENLAGYLLDSPAGVLVVAERENQVIGFIAGLISPWFANARQLAIQEILWWINPEERSSWAAFRLIKKYEEQAKTQGCHFTIMGTHNAPNEDRLIRFYTAKGFQHLQHEFIKEL